MSAEAMRQAVELATVVANAVELPEHVVRAAIVERVSQGAVRSLTAQAALSGAVGRIAEQRVAALLSDADALTLAATRAREGQPLGPSSIGVTREALLRECGVSAAQLG